MIEQNPDGSNRRSGTRTGIFFPISGKICCINEINCRLLQKRNRKAPGYHDKRMNDCLPPILFSAIFKLLKVLPDTELDAC